MTALSQSVLDNIANAAIDYHMNRGTVYKQHIQDKPLLRILDSNKVMFPGGKGNITMRASFQTESDIEGYEGDDAVSFSNPTPIRTVEYPWKNIHTGIRVTHEELNHDGISVGGNNTTTNISGREKTMLANIFEEKLADMSEGYAAGKNEMFWLDGSQDARKVPGIPFFIADDPTVGTVGGIDRATEPRWRNISLAGANAMSTANNDIIVQLQKQVRQLNRFGRPKLKILAGSAFIDQLEKELRLNGSYTESGFGGNNEVGVGKVMQKGLGMYEYDPTLDSLGKEKYCYFIDTNAIKIHVLSGEDKKMHSPERPANRYVLYRSMTWKGGMGAKQLNTSMVAAIQ